MISFVPNRNMRPLTRRTSLWTYVHNEVRLVKGRMFRFGTNEIIAGRAAERQFVGVSVGSQLKSGQTTWTVVGMFESGGSVAETELWCDAHVLQGAYRRGNT